MTSGERRGERDVEREGFAAEKFSFVFGNFWCFFCCCYYICVIDPSFQTSFSFAAAAAAAR